MVSLVPLPTGAPKREEQGAPERPLWFLAGRAYWLPKMAGGRVVSPPVFGKSGYL